MKASSAVPEGSLVYVREGSNAFLRTPAGWSRLLVPCGVPGRAGGGQDPGLDLALGQQILRKERIPPKLSLCLCH